MWWCSGVIRKKRRPPVVWKYAIWISVEPASATNTIPITGSSSQCPVISATVASEAPSGSAPVSPMNSEAGWTLYQRNPSNAPTTVNENVARNSWPCRNAITAYAANATAAVPPSSPSSPSVIETAVVVAITVAIAIAM